jgi:hypothetical protein
MMTLSSAFRMIQNVPPKPPEKPRVHPPVCVKPKAISRASPARMRPKYPNGSNQGCARPRPYTCAAQNTASQIRANSNATRPEGFAGGVRRFRNLPSSQAIIAEAIAPWMMTQNPIQ